MGPPSNSFTMFFTVFYSVFTVGFTVFFRVFYSVFYNVFTVFFTMFFFLFLKKNIFSLKNYHCYHKTQVFRPLEGKIPGMASFFSGRKIGDPIDRVFGKKAVNSLCGRGVKGCTLEFRPPNSGFHGFL